MRELTTDNLTARSCAGLSSLFWLLAANFSCFARPGATGKGADHRIHRGRGSSIRIALQGHSKFAMISTLVVTFDSLGGASERAFGVDWNGAKLRRLSIY